MNLRSLFKRETRTVDSSWQALAEKSAVSSSGQTVDVKSAEGISAVFGCVQALSESTACLPLHVYVRTKDGERERADDHSIARVLREPNDNQTGLAFRESLTASVLLHGNGYAQKEFNGAGELIALHPMNPRGVSIVKLGNGRHRYDYSDNDGNVVRLLQDEVFHLRDRTEPGSIVGKSRITVARETLGLSLAVREHGASSFRNGTRLSGILESERQLTVEQFNQLRDGWRSYTGTDSVGKTFIAPQGIKYKELSMTLEDALWVSASQWSTEEVCRIFRVPPTLVADLRHGNYSNTVELGQQFVRYSLARWINMWEAEIARSLLGRNYYAEHSVEGLLRGNPEARADFYGKAIKDGWMTVAEVRKLENLPKLQELEQIAAT